jgi:hypothetical protein
MRIKELLRDWEAARSEQRTARSYPVCLPAHDAARVQALAEMYGLATSEVIADLLAVALNELERSLPYVKGDKVIAEDELGDPIFEDVGPTPSFLALTRKHRRDLEQAVRSGDGGCGGQA